MTLESFSPQHARELLSINLCLGSSPGSCPLQIRHMRQEAGPVPSDAYPSHPPTEAPLRGVLLPLGDCPSQMFTAKGMKSRPRPVLPTQASLPRELGDHMTGHRGGPPGGFRCPHAPYSSRPGTDLSCCPVKWECLQQSCTVVSWSVLL